MSESMLGGRYRIAAQIGAGGMAQVFRGEDTVLGRPVAIKVLAAHFAKDAAFVARFRREAQAAARLNHPNVVNVYDTGSDDGTHYIVMEFVEGRSLSEFVSGGGRLTPERACELGESVCAALAAAHREGIVHRDIKSGNIMVDRGGRVKVMDFGIAHLDTDQTVEQTAAVLGTASYLSPEQARGEPVDARSDLYSLGCVLYEALTGRVPFAGDSPVSVAYKHVNETPEPPSRLNADVPPSIDAIVLRCLAKNPANRYGSAEELGADLERARSGRPVQATPLLSDQETVLIGRPGAGPSTAVMPPQEPQRTGRKVAVGVIATIAVLALLGGGLFLLAQTLLKSEEPVLVPVPGVVGETIEDAKKILVGQGFEVKTEEQETLDKEPGTVLAQDPAEGEVEKGSTVTLTVAVAPEEVLVPNVVTLPQEVAIKKLRDSKFRVVPVEEESDQPEGTVIRQVPAGDTMAQYGSKVTIYVSSGAPLPIVPDVVCFSLGKATSRIQAEGFNYDVVGTVEPNPACPQKNHVAMQDPEGETQADPDEVVVELWLNAEESPTPSPTKPEKKGKDG